jgi:hypothetical protein
MYYSGESNVPGAPGNLLASNTGGIPNQPLDPRFKQRLQQPGTPPPSGFREQYGLPSASGTLPQAFGMYPGMMVAGVPSFEIPQGQGPLGKRSGEQLQRLYQGGTQQNQQLNEELIRRGLMPGAGPQLPLAQGIPGMAPMGNAGASFYAGPQLGQTVPPGFQNKIVS